MKSKTLGLFAIIAHALCWCVVAQTYDTNNEVVQTFAGSGFSGYLDGTGQLTMFNTPSQIVADTSSNLFVLDYGNDRVREITPVGTVSTFAGGGIASLPGVGTNVNLSLTAHSAMVIDHSNALWITTSSGLLRIGADAHASVTNLTGVTFTSGVCVDSGNNIYYSGENQIYRWQTNGVLAVFAGSGNQGSANGSGIFTSFYNPTTLASDPADNIYVWDSGNYLIRRIDQNQTVSTIAGNDTGNGASNVDGIGTNAAFGSISAMCFDNSGNLIIACSSLGSSLGSSIRKLSATTNVVTMAGSFIQNGYTNGAGDGALFNGATGVCVSQDMIFVADSGNQRIRQISFNPQPQVVSGPNLSLAGYSGLTINGVVGRTYRIQTSPDMTTWNTVATLLLNSTPYLWIDQNPVSGNKFYRALLLP